MMNYIDKIESIQQYNDFLGVETSHPLVTVVELDKVSPLTLKQMNYGLYGIILKRANCGALKYGRCNYDYQDGTIVSIAPGQLFGATNDETVQPKGWALFFHPDLLYGSELASSINEYSFFGYDSNEALHTSIKERTIIEECFRNILSEIKHDIDKHTHRLLIRSIGLLLDFCLRFYDRQFHSRQKINTDILSRFESYVDNYLHNGYAREQGIPSVALCAEKMCLSPNYFGDLIKKETGKTPKEYLQFKIIDMAKTQLLGTNLTINEISESLGFKYPNHMTRLFKNIVGMSPTEYRQLN